MNRNRKTIDRIVNRDVIMTRREAQLAPVVEMMMRRGMAEIPVVDHDHALLGLVTRGDLLNPPAQAPDSAEEFLGSQQASNGITCELDRGFHLQVESGVTVADVMRRNVVALKPDTTAREAAAIMSENRVTVLPVVSSVGVLIGTVSALDLVGMLN